MPDCPRFRDIAGLAVFFRTPILLAPAISPLTLPVTESGEGSGHRHQLQQAVFPLSLVEGARHAESGNNLRDNSGKNQGFLR